MDKDDLLTTGQVAAMFDLTPQTIRRWIESGRLRAIRLPSGVWRVRRSVVAAYLEDAA